KSSSGVGNPRVVRQLNTTDGRDSHGDPAASRSVGEVGPGGRKCSKCAVLDKHNRSLARENNRFEPVNLSIVKLFVGHFPRYLLQPCGGTIETFMGRCRRRRFEARRAMEVRSVGQ